MGTKEVSLVGLVLGLYVLVKGRWDHRKTAKFSTHAS